MSRAPRVLLVAGEASGDLRGAELVRELKAVRPDVEVFGVGGERLREAGMEILVDAEELSTMGITEVFGKAGSILGAYRRIRAAIRGVASAAGAADAARSARPDLVILIDLPDFNLRLAQVAKRAGVPVFYYVSPQVWAWRRYRVRTLARRVDRLAVVFPFEAELYEGLTQVDFVGHPALETVKPARDRAAVRAELGLGESERLVAVLPGSRRAEIESLLPVMREALAAQQNVRGVIALAGEESRAAAEAAGTGGLPVLVGRTWDLVAAADLVLLASGTATLETALLGTPMVVSYRLSALTYAIARLLVRVDHIAMPNLILGHGAVPELIQGDVTVERMAAEARAILDEPGRSEAMRAELARVRTLLGEEGAARRAAAIAAEMLSA